MAGLGRAMLRELLEKYGEKYSEALGIALAGGRRGEIFRWFIASILFGARISEGIAVKTYREFEKQGLLKFENIKNASWETLVYALDEGGYVRYDFSTADDLISVMEDLGKRYDGDLNRLHDSAKDSGDLERRLMEFRGIGPVTANIFLRELRGIWKKADPGMGNLARLSCRKFGIKDAKAFWTRNRIRGYDFINFEAALTRYGKLLKKKNR